jgi:hypothetical protein
MVQDWGYKPWRTDPGLNWDYFRAAMQLKPAAFCGTEAWAIDSTIPFPEIGEPPGQGASPICHEKLGVRQVADWAIRRRPPGRGGIQAAALRVDS